MSIPERRHRRSDHPSEAIHNYLRCAAERHGYLAIALADACGRLLAGSPGAERIAVAAPLVESARGADDRRIIDRVRGDQPLRVWSVLVGGVACYLATLGGDPVPPHDAPVALNRMVGQHA